MKTYTLGFLFKDNKIILAKKKRKIGAGKWNGYGGRIEQGESKFECLKREFAEESSVELKEQDCEELGYVDFVLDGFDLRVYMYHIHSFSGYPIETEEMGEPREFDLGKLPYDEMMVGDDKFIPLIIERKKFTGKMSFTDGEDKLVSCVIE